MTDLSPGAKRELLARLLRTRPAERSIPRVPRGGDLAPSFGQEQWWFGEQLEPEGTWNLLALFDLSGSLEVDALRRSVETIVARHETLRTVFPSKDGTPAQRILVPGRWDLPVLDLRAHSGPAQEEEARRCARALVRAPFDLASGPLFRSVLLRLAESDYRLVLAFHHIISDGWSVEVFFHELTSCYASIAGGTAPPLPDLQIQYADFAQWQRAWLTGEVLETQRAYWAGRLSGDLPILDLPADRPRPPVRTYEGAAHHATIGPAVLGGLRELSRREGVTLFTTLLTAFESMLVRYTGQEDLVVGTYFAGRERPEVQPLIGFFVNTLALRTDLSGDPPFLEALRRSQDVVMGAQTHADFPYDKLVRELQPRRALGRSPILQVNFNKVSLSLDMERSAGGVQFRLLPSYEVHSVVEALSLFASESKERVDLWFIHATEMFDGDTIARMAGHFARLLEGIVAAPERRLSELPLLDEAEVAAIERMATGPREPLDPDASFPRLFAARARERPDAVALERDGLQLSYGELDARANRLAHALRGAGVAPGTVVALCTRRSFELVVGLLGIHKAGAAYLPLDPDHPGERLGFMLADSGAVHLVTADDAAAGIILPEGIRVLELSRADTVAGFPAEAPVQAIRPSDPAYVMYTSGSTGRPKGVRIRHDGLANYLLWASRAYDIAAGCGAPVQSSIAFDLTVTSLLGPLVSGRTAYLVPEGDGVDGLAAALRADRDYSLVKLTPSHLDLLQEQHRLAPLTSRVRVFVIGGEQLLGERLAFWQETMPDAVFVNEYGPTETVVGCCAEWLRGSDRVVGPVPIGRPIANMQIHVLGPDGRNVPIGVVGELYIGGTGVGDGYLNRPTLERTAFIPDPFAGGGGGRLYRTGDRGRYLRDGRLEFLGRLDTQVKLRGYRIELGEVEGALAGIEGVTAAAVMHGAGASGEPRLTGYYVVGRGATLTPADVRAALRSRLPEHMVPSALIPLDTMPVTSNGKVDRRALPAPDEAVPRGATLPRSPVEEVIAGIWCSVLELDRVGIDDNFFELGGYSLLATRVVSRLRETFGVDLHVRDLFERQTVAGLAAHVGALQRTAGPESLPLRPAAKDRRSALSSAQQRLWFFDQLEPGSSAYNIPAVMHLRGRLDRGALEASLTEILRRHEALRTTFRSLEGQPVQEIDPPSDWPVPVTDLRDLAPAARDAEARRLTAEEAGLPFRLAAGPLVRARLVRLEEELHLFLVTFHHIVADGWSLDLFIRELTALYAARTTGQAAALPALPVQYADFAAWQQGWLSGRTPIAELAYWKTQLADMPPALELPLDAPRPIAQTFSGAAAVRLLDRSLRDRLEALSRAENATLFMAVLAAFDVVLARQSGQRDICVGVPVAGRVRTETEHLIGVFVNTLVLRTRLGEQEPFRELLARVRETALAAYAHEELPFERLVEELQPERDLSRTPLFQVMFNMITYRGPATIALPGLRVEPAPLAPTADVHSKFDLTLYGTDEAEGLRLAMVYNAQLFSTERMEALVDELLQLIEAVVAEPLSDAMRTSLITPAAAGVLPDPTVPLPETWCGAVHERVSAHAMAHPAQPAVVDGHGTWTYEALERESNRLANFLMAHGIGREDTVAIHAQRSAGLVWAMLGILKAGAAFVVLDPAYPDERMLQSIRLAPPKGWIELTEADQPPAPIAEYLATLPALVTARWSRPAPEPWAGFPGTPPGIRVGPADLAYVVFTSGTSGIPKGIAGTHGPLSHFFAWHQQTSGLGAEDRFAVLSGLAHDPLLRDVLGALWAGATVCMPDALEFGTPGYLARWMAGQGITVAHVTPAMASLVIEGAGASLPTLRRVFFGGDLLPAALVERMRRLAPRAAYANFYGASETPQAIAWQPIAETRALPARIPVGRGIEGVQLLVLTPAGRLAGVGELGEIQVRTPYLARGYVGDASLTALRFTANPFRNDPADRVYRTGDLGRYRPDGSVEFAGRQDDQVKIRGFRVEVGDVEAALRGLPGVGGAAIVVDRPHGAPSRLVGYVVASGPPLSVQDLRERLRRRLPDYMIPAQFVPLARLPLTPNGKLDRGALRIPEAAPVSGPVAPRTPVEALIATVWSEVIGVTGFGMDDNFFELGGHSLMATQVLSRIRERLGIDLPVRVLFEAPTVAMLASRAEAWRTERVSDAAVEREEISL